MHILGLDIGTSGCKAILFDEEWNVMGYSYKEYNLINEGGGEFGFDAETVWKKIQDVMTEIHEKAKIPIDAFAISALGDAIIPLDKRGLPVRPCIIDFDPRGKEEIREFIEEFGAERLYKITGMPPIHINSLAKILWIKKHDPHNYKRVHRWATFEDYVLQKLGVSPSVSYSMAARTMLFDIHRKCWSQEIIDAAGLNESSLPEVVPSGTIVAEIHGTKSLDFGFSKSAVACSGGHDMVCAAIGAGLDDGDPSTALNIAGTMESIVILSKKPKLNKKMLKNLYPCYPGYRDYVSLSINLTSGSILKWYRDLFSGFHSKNGDRSTFGQLLQAVDANTPGDLILVPHFSGTCNPVFNPDARGSLYGLSLHTTGEDVIQSVIEGLCYELKAHIQGFNDAGISIKRLKIVGGGSQSSTWLQLKANITGVDVINSDVHEASAIGAAALGGVAVGLVDNPYSVAGYIGSNTTRFTPAVDAFELFNEKFLRYQVFKKYVGRFEAN